MEISATGTVCRAEEGIWKGVEGCVSSSRNKVIEMVRLAAVLVGFCFARLSKVR